jgi:hypothetical protein
MTPVFERANTVHALDRAATVIGRKDVWGSGIITPPFLTSALNGVGGQIHAPSSFTPWKKLLHRLNRRLVGPRACLDAEE